LYVIVKPYESVGAVRLGEDPGAKALLDALLLVAGGQRFFLVQHTLFLAVRHDHIIDGRAFQIEGLFQQPDAVGARRAVLRGRRHRPGGRDPGVQAPEGLVREVHDRDVLEWGAEQISRKDLDIAFGYPRRAQVSVDIARQHVLRLDQAQGLDITGIGASSTLGSCQLGPHVAGEVHIGRVPGLGVGVLVDEVAQLRDDLADWRPIQRGDEGQIDAAALIQGDQEPFLGALHGRPRRVAPHHVVVQDGGFLG
jgi:hypothetical protein